MPEPEKCLGDHVVQLAGVANVAEEMVTEAEAEVKAVAQIRRENPLCGDRGFKPRNLAEAYWSIGVVMIRAVKTGHVLLIGLLEKGKRHLKLGSTLDLYGA